MLLVTIADLEWKVVYVGSATNSAYDQELDSVLVGPVPLGTSRFVLEVRHQVSVIATAALPLTLLPVLTLPNCRRLLQTSPRYPRMTCWAQQW